MSISALLIQGLQLMLMGMGFVFVFLGLLVVVVSFVSRVLATNAPPVPATADAVPTSDASSDLLSDPELVSVITAAVQKYRKQTGEPGKE